MAELFCIERHKGGVPVVLLHGFGGSHAVWWKVIERIGAVRRILAFDLPGHGRSLAVSPGGAGASARAILGELERRGIDRAHFVGHSMGGTAAALVALRNPERAASLTLLAPGGFGPEINQDLLRRYAAALEESELAPLLEQFFASGRPLPAGLAAYQAKERRVPGAAAALQTIVQTFFDGAAQKTLPIADLVRLAIPVSVAWGRADRMLPVAQAHRLPETFAVHLLENAGHMLPLETAGEVADLILANSR